jgi:hypothetical protein
MKLDSIYIISYINNEKYKQRSKVIIQQAKWLSQINELNEINYLTQNWDSNLKNSILDIYKNCNKNIIFEEYNYQIKTSIARNKNFKKFYESDKDIAIFMDDDITVETLDKINVFEYYYKYIFNKVKFDVIGFENLKCIKEENCYSIIKHTLWNGSGCILLKNLKKYYNKEIYFDETLPALEDEEFGININYNCLKYLLIINPYFKELTSVSIMFLDNKDRKEKNLLARKMIMKKWNEILKISIFYISKSRLIKTKFKNMFVKNEITKI